MAVIYIENEHNYPVWLLSDKFSVYMVRVLNKGVATHHTNSTSPRAHKNKNIFTEFKVRCKIRKKWLLHALIRVHQLPIRQNEKVFVIL